ncbi:MAG: ATP-binding protein [Planctomycetota bacterium]|jgi:Pyruvate/2-oxoacid:ferredoxin oxidoreductase delta subunit
MIPVIDAFKCNGCAICVKFCPPQVMGLIKKKAVIIDRMCEECGICADVCPIGAVDFELEHYATVEANTDAYTKKR